MDMAFTQTPARLKNVRWLHFYFTLNGQGVCDGDDKGTAIGRHILLNINGWIAISNAGGLVHGQ